MDRRSFLKKMTAAITGAAFTLTGFHTVLGMENNDEEETEDSQNPGGIQMREDDPENPSKGEIWFREDLG